MAKCIDYSTIVACKLGSDEAMRTIIKHYEPMIMDAAKIIRKFPKVNSFLRYKRSHLGVLLL